MNLSLRRGRVITDGLKDVAGAVSVKGHIRFTVQFHTNSDNGQKKGSVVLQVTKVKIQVQ